MSCSVKATLGDYNVLLTKIYFFVIRLSVNQQQSLQKQKEVQ